MMAQGSRCVHKRVSRGLAAATLIVLAGCAGREPRASVSDPAVFTALHLRAAQTSLAAQSTQIGSTIGDMDRYLRTSEKDYQTNRLRMDAMLDTNQRDRAVAQAVLSRISVDIKLLAQSIENNTKDAITDGEGAQSEKDNTDHTAELTEAIKELHTKIDDLAKLATTSIADSPFDTVDRAQDFYTTVLHKSLRNFGVDSHVVPTAETYAVLQASEMLEAALGTLRVAEANLNAAIERQRATNSRVRIGAMAELRAAYQAATNTELPTEPATPSTPPPRAGASTTTPTPGTPSTQVVAVPVVIPPTENTPRVPPVLRTLENIDFLRNPSPLEINDSIERAENSRKAAAEAEAKAAAARQLAAEAETKAALEQYRMAELDLQVHEATMRTDAQAHARRLEWYQKLQEASAKIDSQPDDSQEVEKAREAFNRALEEVRKCTNNYNQVVSSYRNALSGGSPAACIPPNDQMKNGRRLVVLLLQTHVDRGLAPNHMVGVRATITGAKDGTSSVCTDDIRVVRLHPTRNYDREDTLFAEQLSEQILLSAAGKFSSSANGSAARQLATESAEKQKFLSRIPKVSSWADAAKREFGWDFCPNNLSIKRRGPLARSAGLIYGPAARNFEVVAHLDPGARDCAVYMIVPNNVTGITLKLQTITADITDPWDSARRIVSESGSVTVPLPRFHPAEWQSGLGAPASDFTGGLVISPTPMGKPVETSK